jgi:hypothetical protein
MFTAVVFTIAKGGGNPALRMGGGIRKTWNIQTKKWSGIPS